MVVMRMASGALCHINCSRRSVYGRDQRVEAFCSGGMVIENNLTAATIDETNRTADQGPLTGLPDERKQESYLAEVRAFVDAMETGEKPSPSFEDGRRALILADAAVRSLDTGRAVKIDYGE